MIQVIINRHNDKIKSFRISGHAENGPYGYDLVCAGVSAVSFGAVNAVLSLCDISLEIDQADDGGYLQVTIPNDSADEEREKAELILDAMVVSLQTIERDYHKHILISDK